MNSHQRCVARTRIWREGGIPPDWMMPGGDSRKGSKKKARVLAKLREMASKITSLNTGSAVISAEIVPGVPNSAIKSPAKVPAKKPSFWTRLRQALPHRRSRQVA